MSVLLLLLADKGLDYECNSFHTLSFYLWTAVIFASWKESLNGTYRAFPGNKKKCGNFISVRTAPISYWSAGLLGFLSPPLLLQQTIHPFYSTLRSRHHLLLLLPNFFFLRRWGARLFPTRNSSLRRHQSGPLSLFMMSAAEESAGGRRPFIRTAATVMDRSRRPDGTTHSSLCHLQKEKEKEKKFTAICLRRTPSFRNRPETWSNTTQQYVTRQSPWKNLINVYI